MNVVRYFRLGWGLCDSGYGVPLKRPPGVAPPGPINGEIETKIKKPQQDLPTSASLTAGERETFIRWDDESPTVIFWSASRPILRKLMKLGFIPVRTALARDGKLHGMTFEIPLKQFRWGLKRKRSANAPTPFRKASSLGADVKA